MTSVGEMQRVCVLTIQGGGALGIELIGQLEGVTGRRQTGGDNTLVTLGLTSRQLRGHQQELSLRPCTGPATTRVELLT